MAHMPDKDFAGIVSDLVKDAEALRGGRSAERTKAMEYYDGTMRDVPSDTGRSRVVSRDVRATLRKILPSVRRTILANEKVVEYQPVGPEDEESAEAATDYVNSVVFPETAGADAVEDAIFDALLLRNGVLTWRYETKMRVRTSLHTGLDDMAFALLVDNDDVEVLEHSARPETVDRQMVQSHDVRIRRRVKEQRIRIEAVPLDEFLIHPDALCVDDSPIVGRQTRQTRSELVAMGYDRAIVDALPIAGKQDDDDDFERRSAVVEEGRSRALEPIDYYELYVTVDYDDDGIAELRRVVMAGGTKAENILENEEWDEAPFCTVVAERRPHQWEGESLFDSAGEIQKIKTVLLRQTMDNLYWQNAPQPIAQEGAVVNPEAVLNPRFGLPIRIQSGIDVRAALGVHTVPMVADKSFAMLGYLDQELTDRTGISDASGGLAPDALQNMTAKATALIEQAGVGQTELMVATLAAGLKRMFRGVLKLVVQHQDRPRMVRLRGQWVSFDPRSWNADMDAAVNIGLGAGTRERDMMMMMQVLNIVEKLLTAFGPDNPFVKPENLYNVVSRLITASGIKNVDAYLTRPDPQEVKQKFAGAANQPSPELVKVQAQAEAKKAELQIRSELDREKMQADLALKREQLTAELALKREQIDAELRLKAVTGAMHPVGSDVRPGGEPG